MKFNPKVLLLALLIPLGAACSVATVDDSQTALKVTKGKISGCTGAGFKVGSVFTNFKTYPKGVQRTDMLRSATEGDQRGDDSVTVASIEGAQFAIDVTVNYRVTTECQALQGLYRNGIKSEDAVREILIRPATRSTLRDVFAQYTVKAATTTARGEVATKVRNLLNEKLSKRPASGAISVDAVELRNFYLSPDLQAQVDKTIALEAQLQQQAVQRKQQEQAAETARLVAQKQAETDKINAEKSAAVNKINVESEAVQRQIRAESLAQEKRVQAEAEAAANAALARSLTPDLVKLKIAELNAKALSGVQKIIMGSGGQSANVDSLIVDAR